MAQAFDRIAASYDQWYETTEGRAIFVAELECLRLICESFHGQWLEVGVGTGRFASNLGIARGIDPSMPMLKMAAKRGILATNSLVFMRSGHLIDIGEQSLPRLVQTTKDLTAEFDTL